MKLRVIIVAILMLSATAVTSEHPLKMSFSKLSVRSDGNVKLQTRIFLDDLTDHIQKLYGLQFADFSMMNSNGTQSLQEYLKNHFYFEQEGKKVYLFINSVSFSTNKLALVLNLNTSEPLETSKETFIYNTLLCDAFPQQVNDVNFKDQHHELNIGNPKVKIEFNK
ncbi:MAG: DUF6702 family protein [Bacteroidota bacterium]